MADIQETFKNKAFYLKLIVLILCIVAVIFWAGLDSKFAELEGYSQKSLYYDTMLVGTAGYIIIMGILLIIYLTDSTEHLFELLFLVAGFVLNLIAGVLAIFVAIKYDGNFVVLALAALMIANGVIMIIDFIRESGVSFTTVLSLGSTLRQGGSRIVLRRAAQDRHHVGRGRSQRRGNQRTAEEIQATLLAALADRRQNPRIVVVHNLSGNRLRRLGDDGDREQRPAPRGHHVQRVHGLHPHHRDVPRQPLSGQCGPLQDVCSVLNQRRRPLRRDRRPTHRRPLGVRATQRGASQQRPLGSLSVRRAHVRQRRRFHAGRGLYVVYPARFLVICCVCLGFFYEPFKKIQLGDNLHHVGVVYTACTGYMLINTLLLIGIAVGDRIHFVTNVLFSINGAIMFLVAAILLVIDRCRSDNEVFHPRYYLLTMMTISISFAFVNVVVFILDALFTYIQHRFMMLSPLHF